MTRRFCSFPQMVLVALAVVSCSVSCGREEKTSLNIIQEKIDAYELKAKQNIIDAAGSTFVAEHGRNPESLKEMVESGYLDEAAILDKHGNPLPFDPENLTFHTSGPTTMLMSKSCDACGKTVSNNSKVGDVCPHCFVRWGYETTRQVR